MKATRTLTYVLAAVAVLVGATLLAGWPAGSGAAPALTQSSQATPRYRIHLPHVHFDASPTPTPTATPSPTPTVVPTLPPTPTRTTVGAAAALHITRFTPINASTYNRSSLIVLNESQGGQKLTELRIDLSTAIFRDVVFDPHGIAGDEVAKDLTIDLREGTNLSGPHVYEGPHDDGYDVLVLRFGDFDRGDRFEFSIDVDPTSIRGAPGSVDPGSVGGLEMVGATVTATFDNGETIVSQVWRLPDGGAAGAFHSGALAAQRAGLPPRPVISVVGVNTPAVVSNPNQTVRVSGPPGRPVIVLVVEGGLFLNNVPNGGHDLDPFEANSAVTVREYPAVVGAGGTVDVPIALSKTTPESGINAISAVFDDHYGLKGLVSAPLMLELE